MKCTYCNKDIDDESLFRTTEKGYLKANWSCINCMEVYIQTLNVVINDLNNDIDQRFKKGYRLNNHSVQDLVNLTYNTGNISDGYHTFNELYEFRKMYNAALFNEWAKQPTIASAGEGVRGVISIPKQPIQYDVHKSWRHYDGELCFGGGWFIVVAMLPTGQITNHYKAEDWDLFKVPEVEKALFEFDGHTGKDVLERLKQL